MAVLTRNLRDAVITLTDAATVPNTLAIVCEEGGLEYTVSKPRIQVLDRGVLDHVRNGPDVPVAVSFALKFVEWQAESGSVSVADFLQRVEGAAAYTSTAPAGEPYAVDITFAITNPAGAGEQNETITFADFRHEELVFAEGEEYNTISVSGFAFVTTVASVRATQS